MSVGKSFHVRTSRSPVRLFVVSEMSMWPTLGPGDGLITIRSCRVRRGDLRVFEHPGRSGFWLVKRVDHVRDGRFEAVSDNGSVNPVDSRRFGDVPIEGSYLVVARIRSRRSGTREPAVTESRRLGAQWRGRGLLRRIASRRRGCRYPAGRRR